MCACMRICKCVNSFDLLYNFPWYERGYIKDFKHCPINEHSGSSLFLLCFYLVAMAKSAFIWGVGLRFAEVVFLGQSRHICKYGTHK